MREDTRKLYVTMPDGTVWSVPVSVIVQNRLEYYQGAGKADDYDRDPAEGDIIDWAEGNMDWKDVEPFAHREREAKPDYQDGWINGRKSIGERLER